MRAQHCSIFFSATCLWTNHLKLRWTKCVGDFIFFSSTLFYRFTCPLRVITKIYRKIIITSIVHEVDCHWSMLKCPKQLPPDNVHSFSTHIFMCGITPEQLVFWGIYGQHTRVNRFCQTIIVSHRLLWICYVVAEWEGWINASIREKERTRAQERESFDSVFNLHS